MPVGFHLLHSSGHATRLWKTSRLATRENAGRALLFSCYGQFGADGTGTDCGADSCWFGSRAATLHVIGHLIGPDRVQGESPFGHGNDQTVAVSVLLRVAGHLISASANLFADGRQYAAAALVRQMVEIEYAT
jgi:hypothetical protein